MGMNWGRGEGKEKEGGKGNSPLSASSAPNKPTNVSRSTSGWWIATASAQYRAYSASSALVRRGCRCGVVLVGSAFVVVSAASVAASAQSARMMGTVGTGKSGGSGTVMGTEKSSAQRRRSA